MTWIENWEKNSSPSFPFPVMHPYLHVHGRWRAITLRNLESFLAVFIYWHFYVLKCLIKKKIKVVLSKQWWQIRCLNNYHFLPQVPWPIHKVWDFFVLEIPEPTNYTAWYLFWRVAVKHQRNHLLADGQNVIIPVSFHALTIFKHSQLQYVDLLAGINPLYFVNNVATSSTVSLAWLLWSIVQFYNAESYVP